MGPTHLTRTRLSAPGAVIVNGQNGLVIVADDRLSSGEIDRIMAAARLDSEITRKE